MLGKLLLLALSFSLLMLQACSDIKDVSVNAFRKEANTFCYAHSIEYWEKNNLIDALQAAEPTEKQNMLIAEIQSKITSDEMNAVVYGQTKNLPIRDYYHYLQKHIPTLTKDPFDCLAIKEFYPNPSPIEKI